MNSIRKKQICMCAVLTLLLAGCSKPEMPSGDPFANPPGFDPGKDVTDYQQNSDGFSSADSISLEDVEIKISNRDLDSSYDQAKATTVTFGSSSVSINGEGASAAENTVRITAAGTYVISGSSEGEIIVEATKDDKIQLVLSNLTLTNPAGPAILIGQADKVFVTIPEGTATVLSDGNNYTLTYDSSDVDAALFSKDDLTINGAGSLTVTGNKAHGIVSKDDLKIIGTVISVNALSTGINGKDCLIIDGATLSVNAGNDGLKSSNSEDEGRGFIYLKDSSISVSAYDKGIIAEKLLAIESGTISVSSTDDSLHSNNSIIINSGEITLSSSDDGIHGDCSLIINGGNITVEKSYEALEAEVVTINAGTITLNAQDDGINAGGQNSSDNGGGFGFGPRGMGGMMDSDANACLTINGGTILVNSFGDGLDSNGYLVINGGETHVDGPTSNGDGAIDYGIQGTVNGGIIVATGSSGMLEKLSSTKQGVITLVSSGYGKVALYDENNSLIVSHEPSKNYSCIVISAPEITSGKTYILQYGNSSEKIAMDSLEYSNYNSGSNPGRDQGGNQGGRPPRGH